MHQKANLCGHAWVIGLLMVIVLGSLNSVGAQEGLKGLKPREAGIKLNPKRKAIHSITFRTSNPFKRRPAPAGTKYVQVGVTIWRVNSKGIQQVGEEQTLERLDTNARYENGDEFRLSIVSPTRGYLYIVDQDLYADGSYGPAIVAFPTLKTRQGNNLIPAWTSVNIPAYPSVWRFTPRDLTEGERRKTQIAEMLTIVISPRPLVERSRIGDQQLLLEKGEFETWQAKWQIKQKSTIRQFEVENSIGQVIKTKGIEQEGEEANADEFGAQTIYKVAIKPGNPLLVTIPLRFKTTVTGSQQETTQWLVPNRWLQRTIKGAETHSYNSKVDAGQFLHVMVRQHGVDVVVRVYGLDGNLLEERDRPNGKYGEESLSVEVPAAGVYQVKVKPLEDNATAGRYEVTIEQPRPATAQDKQRISAEKTFQAAEKLRLERKKESWEAAALKYQDAAAVWHEIGENGAEGMALNTLSRIYGGLKQADKAMETDTKAVAIFRALKDRSGEGDSLLQIARLFRAKGDLEEALQYYEQSAAAMRLVPDRENESAALEEAAQMLAELGDSQNKSDDKTKAAQSYRRALALYQAAGDKSGAADLRYRLDRLSFGPQPELVTQTGHVGSVESVAYSPDGAVVASGDSSDIKLWSLSTGHELRSFPCHIPYGGRPTVMLPYDPFDRVRSRPYCPLTFSFDGKFLTSVSIANLFFETTLDRKKWNILTGEMADIQRYDLNSDEKDKAKFQFESVAISADGTRAAAANVQNGSISVLDFEKPLQYPIDNKDGRVQSLRFSSDSQTLAALTKNQTVTLWDIKSGHKIQSFDDCKDLFALSNQQKLLACGAADNSINLWDVTTGKRLPSLTGHTSRLVSLTFSPDGKKLVSGSDDKNLLIWDLTNGTKMSGSSSDLLTADMVAFSPDGVLLASGSADRAVKLWSIGTAKEVRGFTSRVSNVAAVAISRRKKLLALCSGNTVSLWDLSSGKRVWTLTADYRLTAVTFSEDGKVVAAGGWSDKVTLWDLESGLARTIGGFGHYVSQLIFSPEGDKIAATGMMSVEVTVADIKSGSTIVSVAPDEITFSPSPELNTSKSAKGKLPEWADFDKFEQQRVVINNGGTVIQVSHSSERVIFRNPTTGKEIASFVDVGPNDWLITTPEGFFDGTASAWKKAIWRFNNNTFDYGAIELYFSEFFRPGLLQEILAAKAPKPQVGRELQNRDRRQPIVKIASIDGKSKEEINAQPADASSTERPAVAITIEATDGTGEKKQALHNATSGAHDLRLFRNGSLVKVWHGDLFSLTGTSDCEQIKPTAPDQPRRVRCQTVVPIIAGENTFTAYAFNSNDVKSKDDVLSFNGSDRLKRRGTFYVLAVGVNDYLRMGKLKYAVDDATELAAILQREQLKLGVYNSTQVITLTDAEATKENMLLALTRFRSDTDKKLPKAPMQLQRIKPLGPEDALVIVFSGHGVADVERYYLLPQDANSAKLRESALSDSELNAILEHVDAGQLLLIIDACQSGKALGQPQEGRGPMNSKGLAQLAYDKGMTILAAAQSYQAALEVSRTLTGKDIKHGLLTFALLDGLTNKRAAADASGNVLERTWFDYAVGEVPKMQKDEMKKRRSKGLQLLFGTNDGEDNEPQQHVQVPRVFYRREENTHPLIVAKP